MGTKKIAGACFIGGAIFGAFALWIVPQFVWIAMLAGFAAGYLSYEFREVLRAVPLAFDATVKGAAKYRLGLLAQEARKWLSEPHPFFAEILAVSLLVFTGFNYFLFGLGVTTGIVKETIIILTMFLASLEIGTVISVLLCFSLTWLGARFAKGEGFYWVPTTDDESILKKLKEKGYRPAPLTYENFFRWQGKGLLLVLQFIVGVVVAIFYLLFWAMWKYIYIALKISIPPIGSFLWELFKIIHSNERLLCGIDGVIGGYISWAWFASDALSLPEQIALVIFGGLLGAAFGIANWEIVSKRILHVPVNSI